MKENVEDRCVSGCARLLRFAGLAALAAMSVRGEIVNFVGDQESGELSNTANWSAETWSSGATQRIDGATATIPSSGLKLSSPLAAAKRLEIKNLTADTFISLGSEENLNVEEIYLSQNGRKTITLSGNVTNLTSIYLNQNNTLALTNGVFHLATGDFYCYNWYDTIKVLKDAELVVSKVNKNGGSGSNSRYAGVRVDGGRITINGYRDGNWSQIIHGNHGDNFLEIVNGGVYYEARTAEFAIKGPRAHFLIDNGGAYISTNAPSGARNMKVGMSSGTFAVTNGTLKSAQLYGGSYSGPLYQNLGVYNSVDYNPTDTRFTFHNARASFQFPSSSVYKGCFMLAGKAARNTVLLDGEDNDFDAYYLLMGGTSNKFTVADGSFKVGDMRLLPGEGNTIEFVGGESYITNVYLISTVHPTNTTISVSGTAKAHFVNSIDLAGTNTAFKVSGGLVDAGISRIALKGPCAVYEYTGGTMTGHLNFASNSGRAFIGNGVEQYATYGSDMRLQSIVFTEGCEDNVLVISNATFTSHVPFMKDLLTTTTGPKSEAIPFTNCPNCRIEFRGDSPKFRVTSNKRYSGDGGAWYSFAIGNNYDSGALKDPLRMRFVLPETAYAEAPVQVTSATAVLGGNAEFEFDATAFRWPARTTRVPLVYNANAFKGYSNWLYIDVDGLNETNADRLPERDGLKSRLELSGDGKTLELVFPGNGGTMVIIR